MYTEELEGFDEAEKAPRAYVSNASQPDAEKLARENEKLKKSLEKEKFFNKLLDQELKDTKAEASTRVPADFVPSRRGVSKGAFYTVLIFALAMAGLILYTLYNNSQYNLFDNTSAASSGQPNSEKSTSAEETTLPQSTTNPAAKDTVPEIIGTASATTQPSEPIKTVVPPAVTNATKKDIVVDENPMKKAAPAPIKPAPPVIEAEESTVITAPPPEQPSRPVIGTYKVTSKANFYNNADENTLRSSFISAGNKTVNALEDKNGFIYVEYVNDNGMINRGWLSKKDLTKE